MAFEEIDLSVGRLASLISGSDPLKEDISPQIITEYIAVFDQLFADGLEDNSIEARIDNLLRKKIPEDELKARKLNFEYIKRIVALKEQLDKLPDTFPSKERLNMRLLEHCSEEWISKFKEGKFSENAEDFNSFRADYVKDATKSTVEVRTWGTKEEIGNGLKNVLRQQMEGDSVGHASLMITIPVNEKNKAMVEKYCLHENGALKVPYSIERYGNGSVYKIYWSYWPGRLNTLSSDIKEERTGFEFTTQSDVLSKLPQEVKERHIFQKRRKDVFGKQHTLDIAPVAATVVTDKNYSAMHQEYLNLKVKKYERDEECQTLKILKDNYLSDGKEFDLADWGEMDKKLIKPSSNFLTIISRFKPEFGDQKLCAQILKGKMITKKQAEYILNESDKLFFKKYEEKEKLGKEVESVMQELYAPAVEIKNIRKEIRAIRQKLPRHEELNDLIKKIEAHKELGREDLSLDKLDDWMDTLDLSEDDRRKYRVDPLTHEKIDELLVDVKKLQDNFLQERLSKANAKLDALLKAPKKETIKLYAEKIQEKEEQVKGIRAKIEELQATVKSVEKDKEKEIQNGDEKIAELGEVLKKFEEDKVVSVEPINQKIIELQSIAEKMQLESSKSIKYADKKLKELQGLYDNFGKQGRIKFYYNNNRERTETEKATFGKTLGHWIVKRREDIPALIDLVKEDRKNLQQGKFPTNIDFIYNRDKTKEEIKQFGNLWISSTKEDVWEISNKDDVEKLASILEKDKAKAEEEFQFEQVNFSYGNIKNRPKTEHEKKDYGKLIFRETQTHSWLIKSKEDVDKIIEIIKADQAKLRENPLRKPVNFSYGTPALHRRTAEEGEEFGKKRFKTGELNWIIKDLEHAQKMISIMQGDIERLESEARVLDKRKKDVSLQSSGGELSKDQIIRGIPTRNATLHDFNIEEMLKKASELASTTSSFNLLEENCSTTTMKLLKAGAPPEVSHMFKWTQNTYQNPADNAFLTNPQAVYGASTLVAKSQSGDKKATASIKAAARIKPNTDYYIKINKLIAYQNDKDKILETLKSDVFGYLGILPHLISDVSVPQDKKHAPKDQQEIDKYLNKINDAVRSQGSTIKYENPLLAIQSMKEQLQQDPANLPLFDEKTLKSVRDYILTIESNDLQNEQDVQLLAEYKKIINERDKRLTCIELAVMGNKNPAIQLQCRVDKAEGLQWAQAPSQQAEIMLAKFTEEYKKYQGAQFAPLLRSNFLSTFPATASTDEKLRIIEKHVLEKSSSASSKVWAICAFSKETLDLVGIKGPQGRSISMISSKTVVTDSIAKARSFKKQYNSSKDSYNPKEQANLGQMSKQPIGTAETTAAKSGTPKDDFKHRLADVRGDLADVRGDDQCPSGKTGVKIKR